ncbi:DNA polymerase ligase N-terminal domain-containing protein [Thalassoroseus pseudoceratinae]|uniref:DNA polymerase ligase N-terminal domain-containing protein n=1 Tax=Thalassoroseus pseudoceratinae TaxID=2713176 RepID=UPI00142420FA|nr:DNA polymerase ligase N-terminal domain-containing protein [Thalassoroseus pseudoceratinae]
MPRFTISRHDHPEVHWDFFLEDGEELLTWRLTHPLDVEEPIAAKKLPSHRLIYLDYSGPVSRNRGTVTKLVTGHFDWLTGDANATIIEVHLTSTEFRGRCELRHIDDDDWACRFQSS